MALEHPNTLSVAEYFQLEERDPSVRYEYIDGHVYAMAGGTADHDTVKSTIQNILWNHLRGKPCRVYSSDMKVYISETRYFHPDVMVTCDPKDRGKIQAIRFPRLIVEVLSPSTELTDRTWKLKNYRAHPTIEEYILADSQAPKIERYYKKGSLWIYDAFEDDDSMLLHSLNIQLSLTEIYADVTFENPSENP